MTNEEWIETVGYFVEESRESLDQCESLFVALDGSSGPADPKVISQIYRLFHGMKGNAGFLQFDALVRITHRAETVLGLLRDAQLSGSPHLVDVLIRTCDVLRRRVEFIATQSRDEPESESDRSLIVELEHLAHPPAEARSETAIPEPIVSSPGRVDLGADSDDTVELLSVPEDVVDAAPTGPAPSERVALPDATPVGVTPSDVVADPGPPPPEWFQQLVSQHRRKKSSKNAAKLPDRTPTTEAVAAPSEVKRSASLRVDVDKLDQLMDLVGELIIAGTAVAHNPMVRDERNEDLHKSVAHLGRIMRGLQDVAMSVRMVPIEPTFRKMGRLVREVSQKQGKLAQLEVSGADTEVDKAVAELIGDPLVHLLRNAVDHGLEPTADRLVRGKPAMGTLRLSARHHGGEVFIRIEDDGRGLSREKILDKAIAQGLVDRARAASLRDEQVWDFIFEPGFSTAAAVTDISGRGVGMDVVKKNIEAMRGRIDVRTVAGQGTSFTLRIPLTLAIVDGLLVRVGDAIFTLPLPGIRESVIVQPRDITRLADGEEVVRIRNELVPVLRIHRQYDLPTACQRLEQGVLVVVEDAGMTLGVFADALVGQRQTVIKPLGGFLGDVRAIAGCTVLGDGQVSLILDVPGLMATVRDRDAGGARI